MVPLPFAAESAPFRPAAAALREKRHPEFAPGASVTVKPAGSPITGYSVEFPEVAGEQRAYLHRLECAKKNADGNWETFTRDDIFADFWIAPKDRTGRAGYRLSAGFFTPGDLYRVTVTPLDWFGRPSPSIATEFRASHAKPTTLWTAENPQSMRFTEYGRNVAMNADGFFTPPSGQGTLELPAGVFANLEPGKLHRFIFDVHTSQPVGDFCAWRVSLSPKGNTGRRIATVQTSPGDPGALRYVMEFTPDKDFPADCVLVMNYRSPGGRLKLLAAELQRA